MRDKSGDMYLLAGFSGLMITLYLAFNWAPSVDTVSYTHLTLPTKA